MQDANVVTIPIAPMGMINAFLVTSSSNRAIIVDSGIAGSERKIEKALAQNGLDFDCVELIVITHAHGDHAGSALELQKRCDAPIVANEADLPYFLQEQAMSYCTTGWFGRFFVRSGVPQKPYGAFTPDILLRPGESLDLQPYGVDGTVLSTPGHTEGSLSIVLSTQRAIVGDLVASGLLLGGIARKGRAKPPPFEDDAHQVAAQLIGLLERDIELFYLGHGGPLPAAEVRRYANSIRQQG